MVLVPTGLTGASAATYGSAGATPVIVVDSDGRITGISTVATTGSGGGGGISNVVEDTTPQLGGGDLDLMIVRMQIWHKLEMLIVTMMTMMSLFKPIMVLVVTFPCRW